MESLCEGCGMAVFVSFLARLYEITGRAIAVTMASALALIASALLKILVKVFRSLYLLNLSMDLIDILPNVRYWSEVLCCTILTHVSDLGSRSQTLKFFVYVKFLVLLNTLYTLYREVYIFWSFSWFLLILCLLDVGLNFYAASSPSPHYPWGQGHRLRNFMLKFVEVGISWTLNGSILTDKRNATDFLCQRF